MEESFGKRLKRIRKERGVTQEQAARHLGIQASTYANWEQERGTPSLAMLPPLADFLCVTLEELLGVSVNEARSQLYQQLGALSPKHQKMVREMIRVMAEAERTS